ncbi:MAG: tetratricopeptide repeat protein [Spirochaetaceae bacterium]|jgi:tetratricopeptide (TPR) repeat protein|nr:tetratricopeptide repeat protein [Spirochaetaceae bacterium]
MKDDNGLPLRPLLFCCLFPLFYSCAGSVQVREIPINRPRPEAKPEQPLRQPHQPESPGSVASVIYALCGEGSPSALFEALNLLPENNIEESEFGRMMSAVAVTLLTKVYEIDAGLPRPDPPKNHIYSRILAEAERGIYRAPPPDSSDYLEHILPFIALLNDTGQSRFSGALVDLEKAQRLNPAGTLALYFAGLALERTGKAGEALARYEAAQALAPDCYPAVFGVARVLREQGQEAEAARVLDALNSRYPSNVVIMRRLAASYLRQNDWDKARQIIDEAMEIKPEDPDLNLMLARTMFEEGQYVQTQAVLDKYAASNMGNRHYTLLRARLWGEGFKNRENAINILNPLYKANPDDFPVALYMTELLIKSDNEDELARGRRLLKKLLRPAENGEEVPLEAIILASEDAVSRADWEEAAEYQERILSEQRTPANLVNAFKVAQGAGNRRAALSLAEELIRDYPDYEEGRVSYAEALIDSGRHAEAQRLIDARLTAISSTLFKSRYYYLRALLRGSFDAAVSDFRSSLFENPRNIDALKALVALYHRRGDERHVVYYLRQALALSPKDAELLEYQKDYAGKM